MSRRGKVDNLILCTIPGNRDASLYKFEITNNVFTLQKQFGVIKNSLEIVILKSVERVVLIFFNSLSVDLQMHVYIFTHSTRFYEGRLLNLF